MAYDAIFRKQLVSIGNLDVRGCVLRALVAVKDDAMTVVQK
jgi:hypothetical protein